MTYPYFSIIIPCYNSEHTIVRALLSVLNQTETDYEIIIVDDGSTDNTVKITKDFLAKCTCEWKIITGGNQGAAGARNKGAQAAQGEFLAFLDSDDEWHREKLSIQRQYLESNNLDFIAAGYTLDPLSKILSEPIVRFYTLQDLLWRNRFSTPGVVVKKDFFWSVGGFESYQRYAEDYTLWMKLAIAKALPAFISPPLVRLHKPAFGAAGLSADSWKMTLGEISGYKYLYKNKNIIFIQFITFLIISLLKYVRRKMILLIRNGRK